MVRPSIRSTLRVSSSKCTFDTLVSTRSQNTHPRPPVKFFDLHSKYFSVGSQAQKIDDIVFDSVHDEHVSTDVEFPVRRQSSAELVIFEFFGQFFAVHEIRQRFDEHFEMQEPILKIPIVGNDTEKMR